MKTTDFTPEQKAQIARDYLSGMQSTNLAEREKTTVNTILKVLRSERIEIRGYPKTFTNEQESEIIRLFLGGKSARELVKEFNVRYTYSIYRVLQRHGVVPDKNHPLNKDQETILIGQFQNGAIIPELAKSWQISKHSVREILTRNKIDLYPGRRTKYRLNSYAFNNLDNELAAWSLGFIYADGSVTYNALRVNIHEDDQYVVERIREFLSSNAEFYHTQRPNYRNGKITHAITLQVTDEYLTNRLKTLGILPRRGHFRLLLKELPPSQYRHFIRGYLDGDGGVNKNPKSPSILFCGQEDILAWIRSVFALEIGTNPNLGIPLKTGIHNLTYCGGRQCRKIMTWLYHDATVWLPRKREAAKLWWT